MLSYNDFRGQYIKQKFKGGLREIFLYSPQVSWFLWRDKDPSSSPFNSETSLTVHLLPCQLPAETEPDWKCGDSHWIFGEWLCVCVCIQCCSNVGISFSYFYLYIFKKCVFSYSKDAIKWWKVTVKTFIIFHINAVLFNLVSNVSVSTKILSSTTVLNNANKKCFLSAKSAYYNYFLWHWRLE